MSSAGEITLATIRKWAEDTMTQIPAAESGRHAAGYRHAARDALAILNLHGRPSREPVRFTHPADEP